MAATVGQSGQEININSLNVQQLKTLHDQLGQEIDLLGNSMQALKQAQSKYSESKNALTAITPENVGTNMMVPLTGSLYVPGQLADGDKVLVDIGTGYFAEKSVKDADEFFKRKVDYLKQQMEKVQPTLQNKYESRQVIGELLNVRMQAQQKQMAKQQATK